MSDEWNEVKTEVWNPEKGDQISGIYLGVQHDVGPKKSNLYTMDVSETKRVNFWGSKILDSHMVGMKIGQQVKIEFTGKVKPEKGNEYKTYKVFTKPLEE